MDRQGGTYKMLEKSIRNKVDDFIIAQMDFFTLNSKRVQNLMENFTKGRSFWEIALNLPE